MSSQIKLLGQKKYSAFLVLTQPHLSRHMPKSPRCIIPTTESYFNKLLLLVSHEELATKKSSEFCIRVVKSDTWKQGENLFSTKPGKLFNYWEQ